MFIPQSRQSLRWSHRPEILCTIVSIFTTISLCAQQPTTGLTLTETSYNNTINSLESGAAFITYNLPDLLTKVVADHGVPVTDSSGEQQNLKYYQTGFTWNSEYEADYSSWEPMGVATWQDSIIGDITEQSLASVDEAVRGTIIVSWTDTATSNSGGVRVTFVVNGTEAGGTQRRYTHVLLAESVAERKDGGVAIQVLDTRQIGAIVWHGEYLYVADGTKGVRVFDLKHIWKIDSKSGFGMEYILPQAWSYDAINFPSTFSDFTFDVLSLDRSTSIPCILASNYQTSETHPTYLIKWDFFPTTGRLQTTTVNRKSIASASWAWSINIARVRGLIWAHEKYFIGRLQQADEKGDLIPWSPGSLTDAIRGVLPKGRGGMAYSQEGDLLWAVGAREGEMGIVGIKAGGYVGGSVPTPTPPTTTQDPTTSSISKSPTPDASSSDKTIEGSVKSKPNAGAIAGAVIGSLLALALLAWVIFTYRRRRRRRQQITSQGDQQEYYNGEIPMIKSELDANFTEVNYPASGSWVAPSGDQLENQSAEHVRKVNENGGRVDRDVRVPVVRKPVPTVLSGAGGEGPWVELPAVEKPLEVS